LDRIEPRMEIQSVQEIIFRDCSDLRVAVFQQLTRFQSPHKARFPASEVSL
jgi:hypothetical protein